MSSSLNVKMEWNAAQLHLLAKMVLCVQAGNAAVQYDDMSAVTRIAGIGRESATAIGLDYDKFIALMIEVANYMPQE